MAIHIRRREFIFTLGGAAAWPVVARAEQPERMRRVGILLAFPESDMLFQAHVRAFREELARLGWAADVNIQFEERWTTDNMDLVRSNAASLVESKPDVIVAQGGRVIPVLLQLTRSIPIVFPGANDPVGTGWVESLARPGGNLTGFAFFELTVFGKMLELLKQIAPATVRAALIFNPDNPNTALYRHLFETYAMPLGIDPIISPVRGLADIGRALEALKQQPNGAALVPTDLTIFAHREQVVSLIARHRLPAIYPERAYVVSGGLISYGADRGAMFRRAAEYVDRILRGEKPGDLPIQQPTKYDLVLNLKTAKALVLEVPDRLLIAADEVIE